MTRLKTNIEEIDLEFNNDEYSFKNSSLNACFTHCEKEGLVLLGAGSQLGTRLLQL